MKRYIKSKLIVDLNSKEKPALSIDDAFEHKIKHRLLIRGFSEEKQLNNRGLISATIDEVALATFEKSIKLASCPNCGLKEQMSFLNFYECLECKKRHYSKNTI